MITNVASICDNVPLSLGLPVAPTCSPCSTSSVNDGKGEKDLYKMIDKLIESAPRMPSDKLKPTKQ